MDDALDELYQAIILQHHRSPKNEGVLEPYTHSAEGFNPLCGDRITVYTREDDQVLSAVRFVAEGCAISRASASIMTTRTTGLPLDTVRERIREVLTLLAGKEEPAIDLDSLGELVALTGVRRFPARIKCATLAWHALRNALNGNREIA
ncbi:MAG TPA: SUF system NifU family Fe-S cluster assembly protein [Verrucomicrobiales bacterium]|nr:SUF system NifU family Fe-S cluster assembly protein [Verrucomicrobiales bacterium]